MTPNQKLSADQKKIIAGQLFRTRIMLGLVLGAIFVPIIIGLNGEFMENLLDFADGRKMEISGEVTEVKVKDNWFGKDRFLITVAGQQIEYDYKLNVKDTFMLEYYPGSKKHSHVLVDSFPGTYVRTLPISEFDYDNIKSSLFISLALSLLVFAGFAWVWLRAYRNHKKTIAGLEQETYSIVEGKVEKASSSSYGSSIRLQINGVDYFPSSRFGKFGIKGERIRLLITDDSKIIFHVEWM